MVSRLLLAACFCALATTAHAETWHCRASWYGSESGSVTASGERFNPNGLTAAHRSLPFGTRLRVTWHDRSVVVRVSDRGPAKWTGRCLDLANGAARQLGMIGAGVGTVTIEQLP
jgi:rare lipoprotein A